MKFTTQGSELSTMITNETTVTITNAAVDMLLTKVGEKTQERIFGFKFIIIKLIQLVELLFFGSYASVGSLPQFDDTTAQQLLTARKALIEWLNHPDQPIRKESVQVNSKLESADSGHTFGARRVLKRERQAARKQIRIAKREAKRDRRGERKGKGRARKEPPPGKVPLVIRLPFPDFGCGFSFIRGLMSSSLQVSPPSNPSNPDAAHMKHGSWSVLPQQAHDNGSDTGLSVSRSAMEIHRQAATMVQTAEKNEKITIDPSIAASRHNFPEKMSKERGAESSALEETAEGAKRLRAEASLLEELATELEFGDWYDNDGQQSGVIHRG
ncbi:hypothetical protein BJ878DRAFT_479789 [Calycina marina]|uniref:Uncharacterized protein n=1 Tax=Calycina marina TaxID=1763456 RepID=A0A9P7Z473_9HELO|nr:hypothetical protein BJ878DRAFT_479789 [Calycina marina]